MMALSEPIATKGETSYFSLRHVSDDIFSKVDNKIVNAFRYYVRTTFELRSKAKRILYDSIKCRYIRQQNYVLHTRL